MRSSVNIEKVSLEKRNLKGNRDRRSLFEEEREKIMEQLKEEKKLQEQENLFKKIKKQAEEKKSLKI